MSQGFLITVFESNFNKKSRKVHPETRMSIILVQFEAILLSTCCKIPFGYNVFEILLTSRLVLRKT